MIFGANEKTLEDNDVKAAPNSNGMFSKSDVTAENATLLDETPVLQYSLNVLILETSWPMSMKLEVRGS